MKLGGQVITAIQAVPNASSSVVPHHPDFSTENLISTLCIAW